MAKEIITKDGELVPVEEFDLPEGYEEGNQSLAVALSRAEIDQQIATARVYPRNPKRVVNNILSLATMDEATAEECIYAMPRGGKPIKGPSVRLAEIIASQWGNCRVGARVVHVDRVEKYVEAEGVFHDLETNAATTARVRRRISDSKGRLYSEDMIVVTGNAACAIAKRNAILGGIPKTVWRKAYDAVEAVLAGDVKTLSERRDAAMKAFAAFGVTPEQVCVAVNVGSVEEISVDHLATLRGMIAALKSGEATVEEVFPRRPAADDAPKGVKNKLDALAEGDKAEEPQDVPKAKSKGEKPASVAEDAEDKGGGESGGNSDDDLDEQASAILDRLGYRPSGIDPDDPRQVIAYSEGMAAFEEGRGRRDFPRNYSKAEIAAWQRGHDYATVAANEGED
jgi:hypothetical protein